MKDQKINHSTIREGDYVCIICVRVVGGWFIIVVRVIKNHRETIDFGTINWKYFFSTCSHIPIRESIIISKVAVITNHPFFISRKKFSEINVASTRIHDIPTVAFEHRPQPFFFIARKVYTYTSLFFLGNCLDDDLYKEKEKKETKQNDRIFL